MTAEANPASDEELLAANFPGTEFTVQQTQQELVLTIGENIRFRRFVRFDGITSTYVHGGGRIGVIVAFDTTKEVAAKPEFAELAKDIAMQVAAINPAYLDPASINPEILEKEKEIYIAQAQNEGKPAAIADKIATGRLAKFFKENCLIEQAFIKDDSVSVAQHLKNKSAELGGEIKITKFVRFEKGEGIEKRQDDFAAEIASLVK